MTGPDLASTEAGGSALSELAQRWANAVAWISYVPLGRAERQAALTGFADRLATAIVADPFSERPGYDVGTDLVAADFAAPETLGSTIQVLDEHLLARPRVAPALRDRGPQPVGPPARRARLRLQLGAAGPDPRRAGGDPGRRLRRPGAGGGGPARERGPVPVRRPARPADRHAEPRTVRRSTGPDVPRGRWRHPDRAVLHRSRRLQGGQRQPGPPDRRPVAGGGGRPADPAGPGAAVRSWPDSAATSSCCCSRTRAAPRTPSRRPTR